MSGSSHAWLASMQPIDVPVSRFEFVPDRPCYYVSDLTTGLLARHVSFGTQCQSAAAPRRSSFSFLTRVSRLSCYRQLVTVGIVVSAIAGFRLVDNLMPSRLQIVHQLNYKLNPVANSDRDTGFPQSVVAASFLPEVKVWGQGSHDANLIDIADSGIVSA